jgi:hypothetical protein
VVAYLALFVALGGSSYAALQLPKGSVGTKQLKKDAVTSAKVKPGSLLLNDFKSSQRELLRGPQGAPGTQGPQGVRGAQGVQGVQGVQGTKGDAGVAGADGSARAAATVSNATIPAFIGTPKGFTAVARPAGVATGVYCLTPSAGVPVVASHAVASVELGASSGDDLFVFPWAEVNQCPAGTLEVQTYDLGGPDPGDPEPSNDVAFSVIIP